MTFLYWIRALGTAALPPSFASNSWVGCSACYNWHMSYYGHTMDTFPVACLALEKLFTELLCSLGDNWSKICPYQACNASPSWRICQYSILTQLKTLKQNSCLVDNFFSTEVTKCKTFINGVAIYYIPHIWRIWGYYGFMWKLPIAHCPP